MRGRWLLLAVAVVVCVAGAGAKPPRILHAEYQLRVLNLATVYHDKTGVEWAQLKFAALSVGFDQPLFVTSSYHGVPIHTRVNKSSIEESLRGSMLVECPGVGKLPLELWNAATRDHWSDGESAKEVLPMYSPGNPLDSSMDIFDAFEYGPGADRLGTHTLYLVVLLARSAPTGPLHSRLEDDALARCSFSYVPVAERQSSVHDPHPTGDDAASDLLRRFPAALANYGGQEIEAQTVTFDAAKPCSLERSVVTMSNESAWSRQALERHVANRSSSPYIRPQSLIQSRLKTSMPLALMFDPIMSGVLKPVVKQTVEFMSGDLLAVLTNDMMHTVIMEVAPDVAIMLQDTLTANLTNILGDSITYTLTKSLCIALTRALGPYLVNKLHSQLTPILHIIFDHVLLKRIPKELNNFLPDLLDRILPITLTHSLTRSLTHALVTTSSPTLTHSRTADNLCYQCYYYGKYCSKCHFSRTSQYYYVYHGTYFATYFADYYSDYYAQALMALDQVLFPAKSGNKLEGE